DVFGKPGSWKWHLLETAHLTEDDFQRCVRFDRGDVQIAEVDRAIVQTRSDRVGEIALRPYFFEQLVREYVGRHAHRGVIGTARWRRGEVTQYVVRGQLPSDNHHVRSDGSQSWRCRRCSAACGELSEAGRDFLDEVLALYVADN